MTHGPLILCDLIDIRQPEFFPKSFPREEAACGLTTLAALQSKREDC